MTTLHVYQSAAHKGMIVEQPKAADGYRKHEPWMLLHDTGRIDRFASQREARQEARKCWPAVTFKREGV